MDLTQVNAIRSELENVALDMLVVIEGGRLANTIGAKQDATARQIVKRVGNGRDIEFQMRPFSGSGGCGPSGWRATQWASALRRAV